MTTTGTRHTPLFALHQELEARMVDFAGWSLPVNYPAGIRAEHLHTRTRASLFDVSHMVQVRVTGEGVAEALEALMPANLVGLAPGRMRYGLLTLEGGGVLDDLMATREDDGFVLVINASRREPDLSHLRAALPASLDLEVLEGQAMMALQGPQAVAAAARLAPGLDGLAFMQSTAATLAGVDCRVSRSGYTGEDGLEIACAGADAEGLARRLLQEPEVAPAGLGARDTLRLEAALCLYGNDLDEDTTPVEAGLSWSIPRLRRPGGARAGGYPGAAAIESQLAEGSPRCRVGLKPTGRAPVRAGAELVDDAGEPAGRVSSGGFGPSVDGPVAMGYVRAGLHTVGTRLAAMVRGRAVELEVVPMPFVVHRYAR